MERREGIWFTLGQYHGSGEDGQAYGNEGAAGGGLTGHDFKHKPAYSALNQLTETQSIL